MIRPFAACLFLAATLGLGACASASGEAHWRGLSMNDLMVEVIDPAANEFWAASGEIDTGEGVSSRAPENEARWTRVLAAARTIETTGALLMEPGKDRGGEWMIWATKMKDTGTAAIAAVEARDAEAAFTVGGELYDACNECHRRFIAGRS